MMSVKRQDPAATARALRAEQVEAQALVALAQRAAVDSRLGPQRAAMARGIVAAVTAELHLADSEPDAVAIAWSQFLLTAMAQRGPAADRSLST